jgi:chemotaxis protein methyltransferase CheR
MSTPMAELTEAEFTKFCALIYKVAGIRIPKTKRVLVTNRVRRRLRATGIAGFSAYYSYLVSAAGAAEMPQFLNEITTNETYFFRDAHHFDWLASTFFPEIAAEGRARRRPKRLRIWSAASSSGEELYSVALRLIPVKSLFAGWSITLLGTDLSRQALDAARAGSYEDRDVRLVPQAEREKYFDHDSAAGRWTLRDEVRAMATWKHHNLLTPLNEDPFDLVLVKNVLIYFDNESKRTATRHLIDAVGRSGYLIVGPTEGIYSMLDPLVRLKPWLYQRPG